MSIPVLRHVRYTDDGCDLYECLSCYKRIESRSGSYESDRFRYCPYCGCHFQSFMPEKLTEEGDSTKIYWDNPRARTERLECEIALLERSRWRGDEWGEWKITTYGPASYVLKRKKNLMENRSDEDGIPVQYQFKFVPYQEVKDVLKTT